MASRFGHRARFCAFGSLAAALALSEVAHASDIPAECGSREAFDAELRQRLGRPAPPSAVHVRIEPQGESFHLRVQIGNDVRELDDASCTELLRAAMVVALSVLMRDERAQVAPPKPPAAPAPAAPRREYPRITAALGAGVVAGSLPKPVFGLELESKALWRHFGVALDLRYLTPAEERDAEDKGVQIQGLSFGVAGLFRPARRWEARLGFAAQRLAGSGSGQIEETLDDVSWALGPRLGLGFVAIDARPFWLGLGAEGQLNALRARFQIRNYSKDISNEARDVFESPWLAASGFVRFGLVF